jgi:hypothetical protein
MVRTEWHDLHTLGRPAQHLIHDVADPDDVHSIATAVEQLRATEVLSGAH